MFNHNFVVALAAYPDSIVVNVSGVTEIAALTQSAEDGAIYRTEGCLAYYMDRSGDVHPLLS